MIPAAFAWKHRAPIMLTLFAALCWAQTKEIERLRDVIAARPKIEAHVEKKEDTKKTTGPVKTTEKFAVVPGNCVPVLIERVTEAAPIVEETAVVSHEDRSERPACTPTPSPWRLVGASANPLRAQDGVTLKVGFTVKNRLDIYAGHSTTGPERVEIGTNFRW